MSSSSSSSGALSRTQPYAQEKEQLGYLECDFTTAWMVYSISDGVCACASASDLKQATGRQSSAMKETIDTHNCNAFHPSSESNFGSGLALETRARRDTEARIVSVMFNPKSISLLPGQRRAKARTEETRGCQQRRGERQSLGKRFKRSIG